jgi:hypothetical protein
VAVVFLVYSVYGIMEQSMISLMHNVFILTLAWTLYPKKPVGELIGRDDVTKLRKYRNIVIAMKTKYCQGMV